MNIVWRKKLKFIALLHFLIVCLQHENIKFLSCLDARSKSAYIVFFRAREVTSRVNLLSARVLSRLWRKSSSDMYFFFNATFLILLRRIERISLIAIITRVIQCVCAYLLYLFSQKQNARLIRYVCFFWARFECISGRVAFLLCANNNDNISMC